PSERRPDLARRSLTPVGRAPLRQPRMPGTQIGSYTVSFDELTSVDPTEARNAKVEEIVWAWQPAYRAGPLAWSKWATLSRDLDRGSRAIDNNAAARGPLPAQPRGRRSQQTGHVGRPRTPTTSLSVP